VAADLGERRVPATLARVLHGLLADGVITRRGRGRYAIGERVLARYLVARG
jgi:DNA-binding IclR family transcriptional regulator